MTDLERYEIIQGDAFKIALKTGYKLRADFRQTSGTVDSNTYDAANDEATFTPTAAGDYYLAFREADGKPWQRLGVLAVVPLVDERLQTLKAELADLTERVSAAESVQYQVSDPSGTAVSRVDLVRLRLQRAWAEIRLARYQRAKQGLQPARFG